MSATLDGFSTLAGHGLITGQSINLLTELAVGSHTFAVNAADHLQNASTKAVRFEIIVTPDSIKDDVRQFMAAGKVTLDEGHSLLGKLDAAAAARANGRCHTASNIYRAFINELNAQRGKKIDATAAQTMIADAQYLILHCP